ncbi:MAG TPA: acyl-CoA desaturase [Bacteroidia bacterium]|nr:acyl-CoA desaturase [Bacteroidia bacterium]
MSSANSIRFNNKQRQFFQVLHQRVDQYFKTEQVSKFGNTGMVIKTICMFALYLTPFFLMLFGVFSGNWGVILGYFMMGLGMAGIGLCIMHDANHGSYSKNKRINTLLSYSLNFVGGHNNNWQMQHNHLHHTYTNIEGHDEDIAPVGVLRFSPHAPLKKIHRFQFIYAWFFYCLMSFMWVTTKDFNQLNRYNKMGLLKQRGLNYNKELFIIIASKIFYYAYIVALPLIFFKCAWWIIPIGFMIKQFTSGLILACIFQPAHVVEATTFPMPDPTGHMETDWSIHQLFTTANFAPKNRILSWFVGGLNYQVEHHLFPAISHVHYRKIAPIVKQTAQEFDLPYHSEPHFVGALWSHTKMLWRLGREEAPAA